MIFLLRRTKKHLCQLVGCYASDTEAIVSIIKCLFKEASHKLHSLSKLGTFLSPALVQIQSGTKAESRIAF